MFKSAKRILKVLFTPEAEKIQFLKKKTYKHFYTVYQAMLYKSSENEVNIPDFLLIDTVKKLASERTRVELEQVIKECRVKKCYANAIKG